MREKRSSLPQDVFQKPVTRKTDRRYGIRIRFRCLAVVWMLAALLCGCGAVPMQPEPAAPPAEAFQCRIQASYRGKEISCTLSRTLEKKTAVTIELPQQARGLSFLWNGGVFSLECAGLSVSGDSCPLPRHAFVPVPYGAVETVISGEGLAETADGVWESFYDAARMRIEMDRATGQITRLSIPELSLDAVFLYDI